MLLSGAAALGMTQRQRIELLESVEDTLDFLTSSLTYLIHAEKPADTARCCLNRRGESLG